MGGLRPAGLSVILPAKPPSLPAGFSATSPPAATVASCKPPARAEHRKAQRKHFANEIDLPQRLAFALVDRERRTGNRHTVVGGERLRRGPVAVCRHTDVDDGSRDDRT